MTASAATVAWRGYWPAAPTPFTSDGALDLDAWRELLELYVAQGVHGVLVNGTTGEWFSQTPAERGDLARVAVEVVAGRVPVVVGVGAFTARQSAELALGVADAGADGVLTTPPPYVHPSDEEIVAYYRTVAGATGLPLMIYNWPRGTAVDMPVDLLDRLCEIDAVVAVKESSGDESKALDTTERLVGRVRVFNRFVYRRGLAALREIGGDGSIDGGGMGAPFAVPFYEAVWSGDLDAAREHASRYTGLTSRIVRSDYSGRFASPTAQLKAAMRLLGQPGGHVREPLIELTDPHRLRGLAAALEGSGLVDALAARGSDPRQRDGWPVAR
jgi:1-pyrroline-4-hydroxy-2-carboxylate deaminase